MAGDASISLDCIGLDRIAVVVPSTPAQWQARSVERLRETTKTTVFEVEESRPREHSTSWLARKLLSRVAGLVDVSPETWNHRGEIEHIGALHRHVQFDAIIWLCRQPPPSDLAQAARLGVWTVRTDSASSAMSAVASLHDIAGPVMRLHVVMTSAGAEFVLRTAVLQIRASEPRRHVARACAVLPMLLANTVRQFFAGATIAILCPSFMAIPTKRRSPWMLPSTIAHDWIRKYWRSLFRHDVWRIGIARRDITDVMRKQAIGKVDWLNLNIPGSAIVADPFVLRNGSREAFVCELMDYAARPGRLVIVDRDGSMLPLEGDLKQSTHLSYPFVLVEGGRAYCIPESASRKEIALYEAVDGWQTWRRVAVLVEQFDGLDATVFRHAGQWWMFCTKSGEGALEDLHIFYSDRLHGPWKPHPGNPVTVDVTGARPAGHVVDVNGELIRLGQDCRLTYGAAVSLRRIVRLDAEAYREEVIGAVCPDTDGKYRYGLHTISAGDGYVVVDGKAQEFVAAEFMRVVRTGVRRAANGVLRKLSR